MLGWASIRVAGTMPENKTKPTSVSVAAFIEALNDQARRADAKALLKHTRGKGCLYIKKLAEVDQQILETLIHKSVRAKRAQHQS